MKANHQPERIPMPNLVALALAAVLLAPAAARAEVQWSGSTHTRYRLFDYDDGLGSKDAAGKDLSKQKLRAWDYRGNVVARAAWENVEAFLGMRLSNVQVNDFNTFNNGGDGTVRLDLAGMKYSLKPTESLAASLTVGRQASPWFFDKLAQHVYDTDVRWDGFHWDLKYGDFGFMASQFVWGARDQGAMGASSYTENEATSSVATTQGGMSVLYAFEPWAKLKLTPEIDTTLAVAFYNWSNAENLSNTIHGGYNSSTMNPNAATGTVVVNNAKIWHVYNQWNLPWNLHAVGELTFNKKVFYTGTREEADSKSFLAGAGYGALKGAGDWTFDYFYTSKGIASMVGLLTNGGIRPDNKGHLFYLRYSPFPKWTLAVVSYFLKEKADKTAAGVATPLSQKQMQWYFSAGVVF